ncbi:F-box domain-containing protein [Artemisia annua]|uniref:F-box domain-containing protein n=1 Tax=Artemisia annua TaxID=35608 RepID=A0A2U1L2X0_ARTAN|nr:F-box domain-containing protein [Artemisia annua]
MTDSLADFYSSRRKKRFDSLIEGMAKTRSMTREQKRLKTSEEGGSAAWSDLFPDLLIIVMMRLGLVDFVSFSGVCKRWRSIAHSQWKTFMGCKVPMCMFFFTPNRRGFWLEDFEGRRFKTIRRHGTHRTCVGSTRGYLIMFGRLTSDFWLVNPITRHEFHFTDFPWRQITHHPANFRGILVYSHSMSGRGFWLEDFEGRRFKTIRRHGTHRTCVGSTRGYLIMFGRLTSDFCLVNPITRHEFHFTDFPWRQITHHPANFRGILVYSHSMSGWVFVVSHKFSKIISFSLAGKQTSWNHIFSSVPILDMHLFKGKIYSLNIHTHLCEVKLEPEPTFVLIGIKNFTIPKIYSIEFVSSGKNLYVVGWITKSMYKVLEVNFDTTEWENPEKTIGQYAFYFNGMCTSAAATAIKPNTEAHGGGRTQSKILCFRSADQSRKEGGLRTIASSMWYFPQDCLNVKLAPMGEMED